MVSTSCTLLSMKTQLEYFCLDSALNILILQEFSGLVKACLSKLPFGSVASLFKNDDLNKEHDLLLNYPLGKQWGRAGINSSWIQPAK